MGGGRQIGQNLGSLARDHMQILQMELLFILFDQRQSVPVPLHGVDSAQRTLAGALH